MPLRILKGVSRHARRLLRYWHRILFTDDWAVEVEEKPRAEFAIEKNGITLAEACTRYAYREADIYLSAELRSRSLDELESVLIHELRHPHYEGIVVLLMLFFDGRRQISRRVALRLIDDHIEALIQRDVAILLALKGKQS